MRLAVLTVVATLSGCTAAKASLQIVQAEQALLRASEQGATTRAAYEYTMAEEYLAKAQEEAGYSEFRIADALARQSAEWSDRAVIFMEERGKGDFQLDDLSDDAPAPFVPVLPDAPAPTGPTEDWLEPSTPTPTPSPDASPEPAPTDPEPDDPYEIEEESDEIEVEGK